MNTNARKRGRKPRPFTTRNNETIDGLYKYPKKDRWRISATGEEFTEPDERLAIERFRRWEAIATAGDGMVNYHTPEHDSRFWNWLRLQIINRPLWVAAKTGIEQIGYLQDLERPTPSPKLLDMTEDYLAHEMPRRASEVRTVMKDFIALAESASLRDITAARAQTWGDSIRKRGHSPARIRDVLAIPKRVVKWSLSRASYDRKQVRHALDELEVLAPPRNTKTIDPHPISRAHFEALLDKAADKPLMKAFLLVSLNCCMYPSEAGSLKWSEIDLNKKTLVSQRKKTSVPRIAVLWQRTIDALTALPRKGIYVFRSSHGLNLKHSAFKVRFDKLRTKASVPVEVKMNHIRDGAYTAAAEAQIPIERIMVLAGHRTGIADHYLKRNPFLAKDAAEAVERAYFGTIAAGESVRNKR